MGLAQKAIARRLSRVGLELVPDPDGEGLAIAEITNPPPLIDGWTVARFGVWAILGRAGMPGMLAGLVGGVYELAELQGSQRSGMLTIEHKLADLTAAALGYAAGHRMRDK